MTKNMMLKAVSDFFAAKGVESMDLATYKSYGSDAPVKDYLLRRAFGSWNRVLSVVKHRHPVEVPVEEPVVEKKAAPKAKKEVKKDVK
tara:strand:+ start:3861 stop:4124 length:264 start_codon:yes stop_codon:yes gene_type:complete